MSPSYMRSLVSRFFDAIERGDIVAVRDIYAPDAVIWHNTDGKETSREENLKTLEGFVAAVPHRRYTDRRVSVFENGFVEQHLLKGRLESGKEVSLPACIICSVKDGHITRLDEYFDSAALAKWRD